MAAAHEVLDLTVLATDICPKALAVAAENVRQHGLGDRVQCRQADLLTLPDDWPHRKDFDVIAGNPPYVADGQPVSETVVGGPHTSSEWRPFCPGSVDDDDDDDGGDCGGTSSC